MGVGEPALWGKPPYGGNRPQRGIRKGCCWLLSRLLWGKPPPTRVIVKAIEKAVAGYCDTYYIFIIPL